MDLQPNSLGHRLLGDPAHEPAGRDDRDQEQVAEHHHDGVVRDPGQLVHAVHDEQGGDPGRDVGQGLLVGEAAAGPDHLPHGVSDAVHPHQHALQQVRDSIEESHVVIPFFLRYPSGRGYSL